MHFEETPLKDCFIIHFSPISDERGQFSRLFCENELHQIGFSKKIVQINHSINRKKGTIRGLHFQKPPFSETKIITCLRGKVIDVAVDLRKNSPTFLKIFSTELSPKADKAILIPEGFAHGFQTMMNNSEMLYLHTEFYNKEADSGLRYDDPALNIKWQLPPVSISQKDLSYPFININTFEGF